MKYKKFVAMNNKGLFYNIGSKLSFAPGGKTKTIDTTDNLQNASALSMSQWMDIKFVERPVQYISVNEERKLTLIPNLKLACPWSLSQTLDVEKLLKSRGWECRYGNNYWVNSAIMKGADLDKCGVDINAAYEIEINRE